MTTPLRTSSMAPHRGAILLEALIGGALLGVGLAVLVSICSQSLSRQKLAEERMIAAHLVDELLSTVLVDGPVDFPKRHATEGQFDPPFEKYFFDVELDDRGDLYPYDVTAKINWFSLGQNREIVIQTAIAFKRGDDVEELREPGERINR